MKYFEPHDSIDCGPVCLKMISHHFGRDYTIQYLRSVSNINRSGVSLYGLSKGAEKIGFTTTTAEVSLNYLIEKTNLPCILYCDNNNFFFLYNVKIERKTYFHIADLGIEKVRIFFFPFGSKIIIQILVISFLRWLNFQ